MNYSKKILLVLPYDNIYPLRNGGMLRCFNLFLQYSRYYDVDLAVVQDKDKFLTCIKDYPSVSPSRVFSAKDFAKPHAVKQPALSRLSNAIRYRWINRQPFAKANSTFLDLYPVFEKLFATTRYKAVVLENLSLTAQSGYFRRRSHGARIVYDAHNVDSDLARNAATAGKMGEQHVAQILEQEMSLAETCDTLLCCSEDDLSRFRELSPALRASYVIPNGVDMRKCPFRGEAKPEMINKILFCGSLDYEPNKEGLLWFFKEVWPAVGARNTNICLQVVGKGSREPFREMESDSSIRFVGEVDSLESYYRECMLAIAPLRSGSGTRLKILEAMSYGAPVITTPVGAMGIECRNGHDIIIEEDPIELAERIVNYAGDPEACNYISRNALTLVGTKYSWDIIGETLKNII